VDEGQGSQPCPASRVSSPAVRAALSPRLRPRAGKRFLLLKTLEELNETNLKRIRNRLEGGQGHALKAAFEAIEVGAVQAGAVGEFVLAPALLGPKRADPLPHRLLDVLQPSQA
jgi:hypothetical protein